MDEYKLKFIQISDLHITEHRDLLKPMITYINNDDVDFVVVTGDLVHTQSRECFKIALDDLSKITHKLFLIPGDYDGGALWMEFFGQPYKSKLVKDYSVVLLDTSFMGHKYAVGWCDVLNESKEQYEWFINELKRDKYHLIFSHHPAKVMINTTNTFCSDELLKDNVRANYCGHVHEPNRLHFKYIDSRKGFNYGFVSTTMKFHGNSCYSLVLVKDNDEIVNVPRVVDMKKTAW